MFIVTEYAALIEIVNLCDGYVHKKRYEYDKEIPQSHNTANLLHQEEETQGHSRTSESRV